MPPDRLSVGATRPPVVSTFNVPLSFLTWVLVLPLMLCAFTSNVAFMILIPIFTGIGRVLIARDHNRPRVLWLSLTSGAKLGDRKRWGAVSMDPLGGRRVR